MKKTLTLASCVLMLSTLTACGSDTVVHEHPVVVQTVPTTVGTPMDSVEHNCVHGYDNSTHSCY